MLFLAFLKLFNKNSKEENKKDFELIRERLRFSDKLSFYSRPTIS